ncbi:MAG: serine/threonine protein kinase [Candidatus Wallbacteria bacterium]|nr:serine/threonine protein kinase [Candidatus Wallbacteria bacterium]
MAHSPAMAVVAGFSRAFLDRYRVVRLLGEGSMGEVYEGLQLHLDRRVAIKLLKADDFHDSENRKRFVDEARILARLAHTNIVTLYDADVDGDRPYIVMEFVEGRTLQRIIDYRGRLSPHEVAPLAAGLIDGLVYLHSANVLHRDLKPENVLMEGGTHPKVVDFGLARAAGGRRLTADGFSVGTPMYMAPEQFMGREANTRTDIYSLGMTLFHALTGSFPISLGQRAELLRAKLLLTRQQLAATARDLPGPLVDVLARCLAPGPDDRFESAAALRAALETAFEVPHESRPPRPAPAPPKPVRTRPGAAWLALVTVPAVALGTVALALLVRRELPAPRGPAALHGSARPVAATGGRSLPAFARISVAPDHARLLLTLATTGPSTLSCGPPGLPSAIERPVASGTRELILDRLTPGTDYRLTLSGTTAAAVATFRTLEREPESGAMLLETSSCEAEDLAVASDGETVSVAWIRKPASGRSTLVLRESPDRGRTWGPVAELPFDPPFEDPVHLLWTTAGLLLSWTNGGDGDHATLWSVRPLGRSKPPALLHPGPDGPVEGHQRWSPPGRLPTNSPGWTLAVRPDGRLDVVARARGPVPHLLEHALWSPLPPPGAGPLAPPTFLPAFTQRSIYWMQAFSAPGGPGVVLADHHEAEDKPVIFWTSAGQHGWSAPRALTLAEELPRHPAAVDTGKRIVVAYENRLGMAVLASADGGADFARNPSILPERFIAKRPTLAARNGEAILACQCYGMGGVVGRRGIALLRSRDGLSWSQPTRLRLWLFEPRDLRIAFAGERLLVFQIDHMKGLMLLDAPRLDDLPAAP